MLRDPQLHRLTQKLLCLGSLTLLIACSSAPVTTAASTSSSSTTSTTSTLQTYFAPPAAGASNTNALTFTLDDQAGNFSELIYPLVGPVGPQVLNAGKIASLQRGLLGLNITTYYSLDSSTLSPAAFVPHTPTPNPEPGSYAIELANQAGGLIQMLGQPAVPVVAATQCPSFASAQTYQFITIPNGLNTGTVAPASFNPTAETAYGSVDIVTTGSTVTFQNIVQHTLPSAGGSGLPQQSPTTASVPGACGSTLLGNTTVVPAQLTITNPGSINPPQNTPPQASIGIGPSGLLVEYNGASTTASVMPNTSPALSYENLLGAGSGAVGVPKPTSALSISSLTGAQYLGFIYSAGVGSSAAGWTSEAASFGFSSTPSNCPPLPPSTSTPLLFGGDFPGNNPANASSGYGACDFAIDLGTPDPNSNNSLYRNVTVRVGAAYASNSTAADYSFPATAIAGQLARKYVIFLIGVDSTQPWAIYLFQSN
jgi:hypothetical protein